MSKNTLKPTHKSDSKTSSKETVKPEETSSKVTDSSTVSINGTNVPRRNVVIGAIVIGALLLGGYMISKWMVVGKVNGETITRSEYTQELEKTSGKQVLEGIATKKIIQQEAKKKNISVSNSDVDAELKKIEDQLKAQGQTLDQVLAFQGLTREGLREQIVIQKTVEMLVGDVTVATSEIDTYIEENQELAGENTDLETLRKTAADQLKQQKTDQKIQELIQNLRQNAKIEYFNE